MQALKYFYPFSREFSDTRTEFDLYLSFKQQIITVTLTAVATLLSLPILGLGGLATFRKLVEHYSFEPYHVGRMPNNPAGRTAERTNHVSQNHVQVISKEQFLDKGVKILLSEEADLENRENYGNILDTLFERFGSPQILLTALRKPSKNERVEVLNLALEIGKSLDSPQQFLKLIEFVNNIKRNRADVIERLLPFCQGISSAEGLELIKKALDKIPEDELHEIQQACKSLMTNFNTALERINCMKAILENISSGSGEAFTILYGNLLQKVTSASLLPEIIQNMLKVSEADIENVENFLDIMNVEDDGTFLALVLRCVADIPEEMRNRLLDGIEGCLQGINGEDLTHVFQILKHISDLEASDRVSVVGFALAHIHEGMNPLERRLILSALVELDDDARANVNDDQLQGIITLKRALMDFFNRISPEDRQVVLSEINRLPIDQRENILQAIRPLMPHIETANQLKNILIGLQMIAPECRDVAIGVAIAQEIPQEYSWQSLLRTAFAIEGTLEASKNYLVQWFQDGHDEQIATNIAQKIYGDINLFGTSRNNVDDPLVNALFAILPLGNHNFNSPHALFHRLVQQDLVSTPELNMPTQSIEGSRVKINQPHFESMVRDRKKITFGELSSDISYNTLEFFFDDFETRLSSLNESDKQHVISKGMGSCLVISGTDRDATPSAHAVWENYLLLKRTFLGSDYVKNVLSSRGEDKQVVPSGYLHAYAVVKFILDASNEIDFSTGLSNQEEVLLRMLSSIQNCSTGKSEGFAEFYSNLPAQYRFVGATQSDSKKEQAIGYMHGAVQSILSHLLTDLGPMVEELIHSNRDSQFVHTRKYLKNLIGKRVGLEWDIAFDLYPGCINGTLKNRNLEEVLTIFYQHFTPEVLVDELFQLIHRDSMFESEEIDFLKAEINIKQGQVETIKTENGIDTLKSELNHLQNQKMSKMLMVRQAKNLVIDLQKKYEEEATVELGQQIQEAENNLQSVIDANKAYEAQLKEAQELYNDAIEQHGINEIEGQIKELNSKLDSIIEENFNQELYEQLLALFEDDSGYLDDEDFVVNPIPNGSFTFIDESYTRAVMTKKGLVNALIRAGYLADEGSSTGGISL